MSISMTNYIFAQKILCDLSETDKERLVKITGKTHEELGKMTLSSVIHVLIYHTKETEALREANQHLESRLEHLEFLYRRFASNHDEVLDVVSEADCL
jgi:hypothetical protein